MPNVQTYNEMSVEVMQATPYPAELVALAQSITMNSVASAEIPAFTHKKAKFLLDAEHASLFEHVVYTFLIQGVSRSFLAQITRQRTASPTSGSQHYQSYEDYPCVIAPNKEGQVKDLYQYLFNTSIEIYKALLEHGEPREEARQVLTNAAAVNYLWTIDARNLYMFLRMRLCHRNVTEMSTFAEQVLSLVRPHFPELFDNVGPQCFMDKCKQGFLQCKRGPWKQPSC